MPIEWGVYPTDGNTVSQEMVDSLGVMMASNSEVKTYSCASFATTKTFVIPQGNSTAYKLFEPYYQTPIQSGNANRVALTEHFKKQAQDAKMSTLIIQFGSPQETQTFDIAVHSQDYVKWPANTIMHSFAQDHSAPIGSEAVFQQGQQTLHAQAGVAHAGIG
jgi:hypothetical protein